MEDNKGILRSFSSIVHSVIESIDRKIGEKRVQANIDEDVEDRCIICFVKEAKLSKLTKLPCKNRCNNNYVHKKCIFEWSERQKTKGSCPLCRGKLQKIDYWPIDYLKTKLIGKSLQNKKVFCLTPVPKEAGMVRCFLKVKNNPWWGSAYLYEFYLQELSIKKYPFGPLPDKTSPTGGDMLLLTGRKRLSFLNLNNRFHLNFNFHLNSTIDVSLSRNYSQHSTDYLGRLEASNITGLEYKLYQKMFTKQPKLQLFQLSKKSATNVVSVATVKYAQNRFGSETGPRRMNFTVPSIEEVPHSKLLKALLGSTKDYEKSILSHAPAPVNQLNEPSKEPMEEQVTYFMTKQAPPLSGSNKKPCWLSEIQAFSLDFNGRVTVASNKNFQIEFDKETVAENEALSHLSNCGTGDEIILQFGKVLGADECRENVSIYTVDFKFPLSPFQALGICISSCDRKMACA